MVKNQDLINLRCKLSDKYSLEYIQIFNKRFWFYGISQINNAKTVDSKSYPKYLPYDIHENIFLQNGS